MPIDKLSDVVRMPRLGKIHLGIKDPERKGAPRATHYFVFPGEEAVKEGKISQELVDILREKYTDKPTELPILIPTEDEDMFASQYYRCYSQTRGLVCKGDGAKCWRTVDMDTGALAGRDTKAGNVTMKELPCEGRECCYYKGEQCREMMLLQFMLPDVPGIGIWQIDTSSINSIININSAVKMYKAILGKISIIPLTLSLKPQVVISPVDNKKKKVYTLNLESKVVLRQMLELAEATPLNRLTAGQVPAPDEDNVDSSVIEGEVIENGDDTPAAEKPEQKPKAKAKAKTKAAPEAEATQAPAPPGASGDEAMWGDLGGGTATPQEAPPAEAAVEPAHKIDPGYVKEAINLAGLSPGVVAVYLAVLLKTKVAEGQGLMDIIDMFNDEQAKWFVTQLDSGLPDMKEKMAANATGKAPAVPAKEKTAAAPAEDKTMIIKDGLPTCQKGLIELCHAHGKSYNEAWIVSRFGSYGVTTALMESDPVGCYNIIKEQMAW